MNWLEFISSLVSSVAWPFTVVLILFFLRAPLLDLIPLVQRMKYNGLEMEFGRKVAEVRGDFSTTLDSPAMGGRFQGPRAT